MQPTCFEVVPDATRPWKPEIAPQAMVMNRNGTIGGAPGGHSRTAGAWITGWSTINPRVSAARPVTSWWEFR